MSCEYGQIKKAGFDTHCFDIDTNQGQFIDFDPCDFAGDLILWNK